MSWLDDHDLAYLEELLRSTSNAAMIRNAVAEIRHYRSAVSKLRARAAAVPAGFVITKQAIEACIDLMEGAE